MRPERSRRNATIARRGVALLGLVALACCRGVEEPRAAAGEQDPPSRTSTVAERVRALEAALPKADVQLDPASSRVTAIQGLEVPTKATSPEEIARTALRMPVVGAALGVSNDLRELCAPRTDRDLQLPNRAIVRMAQCVNGVKVLGAELVMSVKLAPSPSVASLTSSLVPDVPAGSTPRLTAADAAKAARAAIQADPSQAALRGGDVGTPELVVFAPTLFQLEGLPRLCWSIRVRETMVLIDANDGSVVQQYSAVAQ